MRPFQFRFERLLEVRRHDLDSLCSALASSENEVRAAEASLERLRSSLGERGGERQRRLLAGVRSGALAILFRAEEDSYLGIQAARERVETAQARFEELRSEVVEARVKVRSLERLELRERRRHEVALGRAEQRDLEEVARAQRAHREVAT